MLKYSKRCLPKESLVMLYRSLVEPYFRYCCPVWRYCGAALDKLQCLQHRAARIVTNSPYDASALPLIGSLGWLTIREFIDFETSNKFYKFLHALAPDYLRNIFQSYSYQILVQKHRYSMIISYSNVRRSTLAVKFHEMTQELHP